MPYSDIDHRALLLLALIGLDRRRHLVVVVDLGRLDLVALDPALRIDQLVIILHRRAQHGADDLGRAGAVALHADHDSLSPARPRGAGERQRRDRAERQRPAPYRRMSHRCSSLCCIVVQ